MQWTVEDKVILACVKLPFGEQEEVCREIGTLIGSGIDEDAFVRGLMREGVGGFVHFALSQNPSAQTLLPDRILSKLKHGYYCGTSQNVRMLEQLGPVLQELERAGIKTIVWKGAALVEEVYPSGGARGMSDVDLVVLDSDFTRAKQVLEGLGFTAASPAYPSLLSSPGLLLDVHTDIVNSSGSIKARSYAVRMDIEELWSRGLPWQDGYAFIRRLSPCDTVLTLIVHLQRHSFSRLIWFVDIAQYIHHHGERGLWSEREWEDLRRKVETHNLTKGSYFTFQFLRRMLEFPVPQEMLQLAKGERLNLLEQKMFRMLLDGRKFEPWGEFLFFFSIPRHADRLRFIRDLCSPRPETLLQRGNKPGSSKAGYLSRLAKMARLATTSLAKVVRGRPSA